MNRADLLALTADSLAALTNRGLVKRATKEVEGGAGPVVGSDADGAVHGDFPDGVRVVLPAEGGLTAATCTCPATGTCRHVVALVLAYQRGTATDAVSAWSPGEFTDQALEELVGARAIAAARRTLRAGFTARVRRPTAADPVPSVELTACTVRFLVPHQLGYVHTDAASGARDRLLPLAVWAFRAADERAPDAEEVVLDVGGRQSAAGPGSGVGPALALAEEILLDGVVHCGPAMAATVEHVRRDLDAAGLRWPLLALDDLDDQLGAYRSRGAGYRAGRTAYLIAELHARHLAATGPTGPESSPRSRVLGTREAASTPLRRSRLIGLGCRVGVPAGIHDRPTSVPTGPDCRTVDVYLAHPDTASVLVLRRGWKSDGQPLTGSDLSRRRVGGIRLGMLASGDIVSESAVRSASRMVRLATSQLATSTATAFGGGWDALPEALLVTDLARESERMGELPPRLIRPRVEAEFVKAVRIGAVCSIGYLPGDQRLTAVIEDPAGRRATVSATYRSACPGALDALAGALDGADGPPRYVSGMLRRTRGGIVIDPLAVVAGSRLIVPDLAPGDGTAGLDVGPAARRPGPIETAVQAALSLLAEVAHLGLRHLPPTFPSRLTAAADALVTVGLPAAGRCVGEVAAVLGPDPDGAAVAAWVAAQIRLTVTDELL